MYKYNNIILSAPHCIIIITMDSCNSGSIQSSSCGDDEYDSRAQESNNISAAAAAASAFLNNPSRNHVGPFTTTNSHSSNLNPHPSPPPSSQQQQNHTHIFDPSLSNYLDSIQKSPNPFLNLDMLWSKPPRSEPNQTDLAALMLPSSSSQQQNQAFLLSQLAGQSQTTGSVNVSAVTPESSLLRGGLLANDQAVSNNSGTTTNNNNNVRNSKKRSRASRRAPTTVLTTDTTNFRAMVQEFTGIPPPPFTSSPFPRTRLDLFGSSTTRSTFDPSSTPPPYLLRPFAQKLQPTPSHHPFQPSSSSMVENLASNNHNPSYNNLSSSTSQADHHLGLFNMHNSILGFQNITPPPPPKYQHGNSSKTQPSLEISPGTVDSHMKMNVLEELGLSHTHTNIGGLHENMVSGTSSDGGTLMSRLNNNNINNNMGNSLAGEWAQRRVSTVTDNDRGILGSGVNYRSDNIQERVSNAKVVNYTASSSGPECGVVGRGEGTVESWINCSSSD